jgi:hypothetical protein
LVVAQEEVRLSACVLYVDAGIKGHVGEVANDTSLTVAPKIGDSGAKITAAHEVEGKLASLAPSAPLTSWACP